MSRIEVRCNLWETSTRRASKFNARISPGNRMLGRGKEHLRLHKSKVHKSKMTTTICSLLNQNIYTARNARTLMEFWAIKSLKKESWVLKSIKISTKSSGNQLLNLWRETWSLKVSIPTRYKSWKNISKKPKHKTNSSGKGLPTTCSRTRNNSKDEHQRMPKT